MNSPFFNHEQLNLYFDCIEPYIQLTDKELYLATLCAFLAHGQKRDREGLPYILHPIRVSSHLTDRESKIVALLHDVLEDSSINAEDLHEMGFSSSVIDAVVSLTRKPLQSYASYLDQVAQNPLAKRVKIADVIDNMDPDRMKSLDFATRLRLTSKYTKALDFLSSD